MDKKVEIDASVVDQSQVDSGYLRGIEKYFRIRERAYVDGASTRIIFADFGGHGGLF